MMCKIRKQKMNKKAGNKTFTECKISTTFQKIFLFFLRFWTANSKDFHSTTSYLWFKWTAKNYEIKYFSLANDAETHSSTKEENEKRFFFFILEVLVKQERENTDKQKTKKNNSGLKHRSQRIGLKNQTMAIVKTMTLTLF